MRRRDDHSGYGNTDWKPGYIGAVNLGPRYVGPNAIPDPIAVNPEPNR